MAVVISGARVLSALLIIFAFDLPSLHPVSGQDNRGLACTPPVLTNGRVKLLDRGTVARFRCRGSSILWGPKYANCIYGEWDNSPPICVVPGCHPLSPLASGSIKFKYQGAVALLICHKGHYLDVTTQRFFGRGAVTIRTSGYGHIYCDGRKWNSTRYQCTPMVTTARPLITSSTLGSTHKETSSTAPHLMTKSSYLSIFNMTATTEYPDTTVTLEAGATSWIVRGDGDEVLSQGTTSDLGSGITEQVNVTTLPPQTVAPSPGFITTLSTSTLTPSTLPSPFTTSSSRPSPFNTTSTRPIPSNTTSTRPSPSNTTSPQPFPSNTTSTWPSPSNTTSTRLMPSTTTSTHPRSTMKIIPSQQWSKAPNSSTALAPRKTTSTPRPWITLSSIPTTLEGKTLVPPTWCDFSGHPMVTSVWKRGPNSRLTRMDPTPISVSPTCGWDQPASGPMEMAWKLSVNADVGPSVPAWKEPSGSYLKVVIMMEGTKEDKNLAMLISPSYKQSAFSPEGLLSCFSFWYKGLNSILKVMIYSNGTSTQIWMDKDKGPMWSFVTVELKPKADEFRLALIASSTSKIYGSVAVDNLWLANHTVCEAIRRNYMTATSSSRATTRPGPRGNTTITTSLPRRTQLPRSRTKPSKQNSTTPTPTSSAPTSTVPAPRPPSTQWTVTTSSFPRLRSNASSHLPQLPAEADDSTGGIPQVVIWSAAVLSVVAVLLVVAACARRLLIRRRTSLREGGDGDSDVRYLTSDEEHLDFNLQTVAWEGM